MGRTKSVKKANITMQRTLRRKKPRPSSLKQYSTMGTLSRMLDKPMGIPNRWYKMAPTPAMPSIGTWAATAKL